MLAAVLSIACPGSASAAPVTTEPETTGAVLPCNAIGGEQHGADAGRTVIGKRVALTLHRGLGASAPPPSRADATFFAKDGLIVRRGTAFELVVPAGWRGRLSLSWGNSARTDRLIVRPCGVPHAPGVGPRWLAFAGGYYVTDRACVPLIVRTPQKEYRVKIGVGAPCKGQAPPVDNG